MAIGGLYRQIGDDHRSAAMLPVSYTGAPNGLSFENPSARIRR